MSASAPLLERRIVQSIAPAPLEPRAVLREFRELSDDGRRVVCVGAAWRNPRRLLALGYVPRYKLELFGVTWYVCDVRQNEDVRFYVAYVLHQGQLYARLLYKDGSLLWRCASHFAKSPTENWIGKGDLKEVEEDGEIVTYTAEHTTDLPLEMQMAVESLMSRAARVVTDTAALALVVRRSPDSRLCAYRDFIAPRRRAAANPRNLVNGGKSIARFGKANVPESLRFASGYEPDFRSGFIDVTHSHSRLYEGEVARYRILSTNGRMQYLFFAAPRLAWLGYPQPLTTELSSYGVRTVDVTVPDDLVVPAMEYHYREFDDPPVWMSQIPPGFAGAISPNDDYRADASAWLDRLPVIVEFRRWLLRDPTRARVSPGGGRASRGRPAAARATTRRPAPRA